MIIPKIYRDCNSFFKAMPQNPVIFKSRRKKYIRICAGFDIETTNIVKYHEIEIKHKNGTTESKRVYDRIAAYAYHFQFAINDNVLLVRTWNECIETLHFLNEYAKKHAGRIIIWIANLSFEFQFLRKRIPISTVFAREMRKPMYFTSDFLEFRDCLKLTASNLDYLSKHYCDTKKMVGDLDYTIIRNSKTPLTPEEEKYCINDVVILSEFANYCFTTYTDNGEKIPYTSTGIVRQMIKNNVESNAERKKKITNFISRAYIPSKKKYIVDMQYLFRGGLTHANAYNANRIIKNVFGVDLRSSYPAVMLQEYYPMGVFTECRIKTDGKYITDNIINTKCCIFIAEFTNIRAKTHHTLESKSKIILPQNETERKAALSKMKFDNGRLWKCSGKIKVFLTELDYDSYTKYYEWDCIEIIYSRCAPRGKLPEYLLQPLRDLYRRKDELKSQGADNKYSPLNSEYKIIKSRINAFFGMCCTRLMFVNPDYNNVAHVWEMRDSNKTLSALKRGAFLSPYWGIYIAGHARHRLCSVIMEIDGDKTKNDVIYYDTDSIYFQNENNLKIIDAYNKRINALNSDFDMLGCFDFIDEKQYSDFKTIGAKRYLKRTADGKIIATIAGLNGDDFVKKYGEKSFENFSLSGFSLDAECTNKNMCFYIDDECTDIVDGEMMHEYSCAVISEIGFKIKMLDVYENVIRDYIAGL